jgi:hypothetical protein
MQALCRGGIEDVAGVLARQRPQNDTGRFLLSDGGACALDPIAARCETQSVEAPGALPCVSLWTLSVFNIL